MKLLGRTDKINPNDWCRPLIRSADFESHSDMWSETNMYGGSPLDHLLWVPVWLKLGAVWWGDTYAAFEDFQTTGMRYEFVRGTMPANHVIDLESDKWKHRHPTYYSRTKKLHDQVMYRIIDFGAHKDHTVQWVHKHYPNWLEWAMAKTDKPYWKEVKEQLNLESVKVYYHPQYNKYRKPKNGLIIKTSVHSSK